MRGIATLALLVGQGAVMACSNRLVPLTVPEDGATHSNGGSVGGGPDGDGAAASGCHADTGARLVCDRSTVDGVPCGPFVTVRRALGNPPAPEGGAIVPGAYQLVSETLYGNVEPNTDAPRAGDRLRRILHVDCDVMNELYQLDPSVALGAGNDCRRLVSRELSVLELSGWIVTSGPPIPDSRDDVSYTANGTSLTLLFRYDYHESSRGPTVLGSYTYASRFELISGRGLDASATSEDAGASFPGPTGRDPRCPATPPANGDPCSPDPAPLECEYGGDAYHRCTTFAACVMDLSGAFHFSVDAPSACTPPNPAACPSSFAAAMALSARSDAGSSAVDAGSPIAPLVCNYPEGVCACRQQSSPSQACAWSCNGGATLDDGGMDSRCPLPRPLAGDPCTPGLECGYARGCGDPTSIGPSMICQAGYWADRGDMWHCPAF